MSEITVLLPVYNAEQHLAESLRSLLEQTFRDFLILAVDDGSIDKSLDILHSFDDSRLKVLTRPQNMGIVATLNEGLDQIDTPFIARMDADDVAHPNRLEWQLDYLKHHQRVDVVGGAMELFGNQEAVWSYPEYHKLIKAHLLFNPGLAHPACMMRSPVFANNVRYSGEYPHMEDYELWYRLKDRLRFGNLPNVVCYYRQDAGTVTQLNRHSHQERIKKMYKTVLQELTLEPDKTMLDIHYQISNWKRVSYQPEVYHDHIKNIIEANRQKRVYDEVAVKRILYTRWSRLFYKLVDAGNDDWVNQYKRLNGGISMKKRYYKLRHR